MDIFIDCFHEERCFASPSTFTQEFLEDIKEEFDMEQGTLYTKEGKELNLGDPIVCLYYDFKPSEREKAINELNFLGEEISVDNFIKSNNFKVLSLLLKAGIDVNSECYWGINILCYAIKNNNPEKVKFLCENGADSDISHYLDESLLNFTNINISEEIKEILESYKTI